MFVNDITFAFSCAGLSLSVGEVTILAESAYVCHYSTVFVGYAEPTEYGCVRIEIDKVEMICHA